MSYRKRPNSDFLLLADWQSIHALSIHWSSDMEFYRDELRFLETLIDKYFVWLNKEEKLKALHLLDAEIKKANKVCLQLLNRINDHTLFLERIISKSLEEDTEEFRQEHIKLEDELVVFLKNHTRLKREVFEITERAVDEDLLNNSDLAQVS